jgi:hypothetical protein
MAAVYFSEAHSFELYGSEGGGSGVCRSPLYRFAADFNRQQISERGSIERVVGAGSSGSRVAEDGVAPRSCGSALRPGELQWHRQ